MLPSFRFLFAAIVLSISMLIFGLGAAALLRAAHEEFAGIPSWRAPPEIVFAQRDAGPALAMLRVDASAAADEKVLSSPTPDNMQVAAPTSEQSAFAPAAAELEKSATEPEKIGALPEVATAAENPLSSEAPPPEASTPEPATRAETPVQIKTPSPAAETKVAAIAEITPAALNQMIAAAAPEQAREPADESTRIAETRIATLGGPPVTIEPRTPSKRAPAVVKKPVQARHVVKRRRIVQRARVARPAPQRPANPFGTPSGSWPAL
jgi:hypothetical protein